jgi:dGTPase
MDLSHPSPAALQAAHHDWIWRARRSGQDLQRARSSDYRDPFARDRARLLHSAASRRLMGKSQVPGLLGSMLPRAWQTHVLEVSQLSRGMLRALQHLHAPGEPWLPWLPDVNLLEAIALGRALGHAPFGPVGDQTLAELMREHGGFDPAGRPCG